MIANFFGSDRTRLNEGSYQKTTRKGGFLVNYFLAFFSAKAFGLSISPFFFNVLSADAETLHLTFCPLIISVRLDTFGLNTLRVWR